MPRWLRKDELVVVSFQQSPQLERGTPWENHQTGQVNSESMIITPFNFLSFYFQLFLIDDTCVFLDY